jgi:hypothetical protein
VGSGPVQATVVKQRLADVFIYRMRTVQAHGVGLLNLYDAEAPQTFNAKQLTRDFG